MLMRIAKQMSVKSKKDHIHMLNNVDHFPVDLQRNQILINFLSLCSSSYISNWIIQSNVYNHSHSHYESLWVFFEVHLFLGFSDWLH